MAETIFDAIVRDEMRSWKIWESDTHLAFLTPFPNTPGAAVVIPKENIGGNVLDIDSQAYVDLMWSARHVANVLRETFNVTRVAIVAEGTGVDYVHVKLYPLHGELGAETDVWAGEEVFNDTYKGYITTQEGPKMDDEELDRYQQLITGEKVQESGDAVA